MGWLWGDDERLLTSQEEALIRKVFRHAVLPPLSRIRIRNGLSPNDTPFTTPRSQYVRDTRQPQKQTVYEEYLIMVGQRLFDGDVAVQDPSTLVHEMTHVWQYKHGTLSQWHAVSAHVHYWGRDKVGTGKYEDLYKYEIGESWDDIGFEGQAQLVEDWFTQDGMSEDCPRWHYFKNVILDDNPNARSASLVDLMMWDTPVDPPNDGVRQVAFDDPPPFPEAYFLSLLERPVTADDVARMAARVSDLEAYCRGFRRYHMSEAGALATRLDARKAGDKLAQVFHYRLSTPTRVRLISILRGAS